jgi:hypothetical protein
MPTNNSINNNSLTLISTQTVSSVTSLVFTGDIAGSDINYFISSNNVTSAGTGYALLAQVSTDNGSTYISAGYLSAGIGITTGLTVVTYGTFDATINASSQCSLLNIGTTLGLVTSFSESIGWSAVSGLTYFAEPGIYTIPSTNVNAFQLVMNDGSTFSGTFSLYSYSS